MKTVFTFQYNGKRYVHESLDGAIQKAQSLFPERWLDFGTKESDHGVIVSAFEPATHSTSTYYRRDIHITKTEVEA